MFIPSRFEMEPVVPYFSLNENLSIMLSTIVLMEFVLVLDGDAVHRMPYYYL